MTIEAWTPSAVAVITHTGPYAIGHPYEAGTIVASVIVDGDVVPLDPADYTVDPVSATVSGALTLSVAAAALHDGRDLWIDRRTQAEQGWVGVLGERERGLERQLDRMTMLAQEHAAALDGTLRVRGAVPPYEPQDGRVPIWSDTDGGFVNGPSGAEIEGAVAALDGAAAIVAQVYFCTPQAFGAVGDGLADDSAALAAAITDGRPLHWGDAVYRITTPVDVTLTGAAQWRSAGARIIYDGSVAQNALRIEAAGFDFRLDGDLIVDANAKAFCALAVENGNPMPRPTLAMTGIHVRNAYRSSTAFARGDGLLIKGGWRTIYLERPIAANCVMAAGAGIMGVQGIFGITITYGTAYPDEITIIHPEISEVYCEDVTYPYDQDGLRIFTAEDSATDPMPWPTHFSVIGGRFHNCRGRSIKSQCELGVVQGAKFIRDKGWLDAPGGVPRLGNYEVDFQVGGGFLVDCEFHYRDYAPQALVLFSGTRETGGIDRLSSGGTLRGAKVFLHDTPVMSRLAAFSPYEADDFTVLVDDVQVVSSAALVEYVVRGSTSDTTGDEFISISNFRGRLSLAFAYLVGSGAADLAVRDSINLGAAVPLRDGLSAGNTTAERVVGATNATQLTAEAGDRIGFNVLGTRVATLRNGFLGIGTQDPQADLDLGRQGGSIALRNNTAGAVASIGWISSVGGLKYDYDQRALRGVELSSPIYPVTVQAGAGDGLRMLSDNGAHEMALDANGVLAVPGPVTLASFAKAALPTVATVGRVIVVTDDVGGIVLAFSDGANWRRVTDRAVIS